MNDLWKAILTEGGVFALLFFLTLVGIYRQTSKFSDRYLDQQKEHNDEFLKDFKNMIEKISTGDKLHSDEHNKIMNFLEDKHKNNNAEHKDIIKLVGQIDKNVSRNTNNIEILSKEIRLHHSA